jgi:hypothetical protein
MNATDTDTSEKSQRQLAAGVFNQATRDLQRFHGATTKIEQELYFDAYSWVISDDYSWPFSFLNVCRLLDLAPEDLRQELLGDLSLGLFSRWARRCNWAAGRLQRLLVRQFSYR